MTSKKAIDEKYDSSDPKGAEIDLSQLMRNLTLTPERRLAEHQSALDLMIELERAGAKLREQSQ